MGTRIVSKFSVKDTDPFVRYHRVQDIHILPGVAMLDAVYKTFAARRIDPGTITLENILFHEPVVTNATVDRKLTLTWDMQEAGGRITVSSVPWRNDAQLSDRVTTHMTCSVRQSPFSLDACALELPSDATDLDACYDVTRRIGIFHEGFMKCTGRVGRLDSGHYLGEIALGPEAARARGFQLHPVFLDCSTIVPLLAVRKQLGGQGLFIPIAIERFRATSLLGHTKLRVLVEPFEQQRTDAELVRYRFGMFDSRGHGLAQVENFTVKRVRSLESIRELLTRSNAVIAVVPERPVRAETTEAKDAIRSLIGQILGQLGNFEYSASDDSKPFFELGLSSAELLEAVETLETRLQVTLYPTTLFEHPNVAALALHLRETHPDACQRVEGAQNTTTPVAHRETTAPARAQTPRPGGSTSVGASSDKSQPTPESLTSKIVALVTARAPDLQVTPAVLERPFFELGLDSNALLEVADDLETQLQIRVYPTTLFEHPTISALARHLEREFPEACAPPTQVAHVDEDTPPSAPRQSRVVMRPANVETEVAPPTINLSPSSEAAQVFTPRWVPVAREPHETGRGAALLVESIPSELGQRLAERYGSRAVFRATAAEFETLLASSPSFEEVCLVNLDHNTAFRVVQALRAAGRLVRGLNLRSVTVGCFQIHDEPVGMDAPHGVWGLLLSTSREYPEVTVSGWDLDPRELSTALSDQILATTPTRTLRARRRGRSYRRILVPVAPARETAGIAPPGCGATFVVVGGAGGVGLEWVRHLRAHYGARVAVIGRRDARSAIEAGLASLPEFGQEVTYHRADLVDEVALADVFRAIRTAFGSIHCVVHSAMVLDDRRLSEMDAACFERVQAPKVSGARTLAKVAEQFGAEHLLFFSAAQAFVGNLGQANYAAASTYIDGLASALRSTSPLKITTINWGYWGEVGAVTSEHYQRLLARQGVFGMTTKDALTRLDEVLAGGVEQALIMRGNEAVLAEMHVEREFVVMRPRAATQSRPTLGSTALDAQVAAEFENTRLGVDRLVAAGLRRVAGVLGEIDVERRPLASAHARLLPVLRSLSHGQPRTSEAEFVAEVNELASSQPTLTALIPLLQAAILAYPDVLTGRKPAMAALFPGGRNDLVRPVYADSSVSHYFNAVAASTVQQLAQSTGHTLRILEVGAGTGATTRAILDALRSAGSACEYWYTELWDALLTDARTRLGATYPELRFACLDAGLDPATQGFAGGNYDVVVATNVLHATRDVHASVRHLKKLLRPGGTLVVNESITTQTYSTLTFGLLPGWWHAVDAEQRLPNSPLLDEQRWLDTLADEGFVGGFGLVPTDANGAVPGGQQVFVATSDGEIRTPHVAPVEVAPRRTERAARTELPPALVGKLREFEPRTAPRARRIATYTDHRDNVWVFMNNPPANMFDDEFLAELCATLQGIAAEVEQRGRVVYLSHFGEYFSLGGDRSELIKNLSNPLAIEAFADKVRALFRTITSLNAIVVAVVNGTAQGGGLETLFATDLQVVRNGVKLGLPEVRSGLIPGMGGLTQLQSVLGPARTKRLVLLGELIDASEALELGIVSHVADDPFTSALGIGESIKHLEAALQMKRILRPEAANRLCADIDEWVRYLGAHAGVIDARRIENSRLLVSGRAALGVRR